MHNEEGVDEDEKVDEREEEVEEEDNEEEQEAAAMGEEDHHDDNDYEEEENEEAEDWQSESRSYPCSVCGKVSPFPLLTEPASSLIPAFVSLALSHRVYVAES